MGCKQNTKSGHVPLIRFKFPFLCSKFFIQRPEREATGFGEEFGRSHGARSLCSSQLQLRPAARRSAAAQSADESSERSCTELCAVQLAERAALRYRSLSLAIAIATQRVETPLPALAGFGFEFSSKTLPPRQVGSARASPSPTSLRSAPTDPAAPTTIQAPDPAGLPSLPPSFRTRPGIWRKFAPRASHLVTRGDGRGVGGGRVKQPGVESLVVRVRAVDGCAVLVRDLTSCLPAERDRA
jgi:hypothetical protein